MVVFVIPGWMVSLPLVLSNNLNTLLFGHTIVYYGEGGSVVCYLVMVSTWFAIRL